MTTNQSIALWELCRQGLPLAADEAAESWTRGLPFELPSGVRISRSLDALIEQCNWEVSQQEEAQAA
jgi:hypothetical protein